MIPSLTNPPFSPNFSGNAASNNSATNVGSMANSSSPGGNSGGLGSGSGGGSVPPGGEGGDLPGTPAQSNKFIMVYNPHVIGGGVDNYLRPWTGGSLDPRDHDYHARTNPTCHTVRCLRSMEMENKNYSSITNGVEICTKLNPKSNLLTSAKVGCGVD